MHTKEIAVVQCCAAEQLRALQHSARRAAAATLGLHSISIFHHKCTNINLSEL